MSPQQLKRLIGQPVMAKLPKCPGKSSSRCFALKRDYDEDFHYKPDHFCELCACQNVAGNKTSHKGYGWCSDCEKSQSRDNCIKTARDHLTALQQHIPFVYRDPNKWLERVQQEGASAQQGMELAAEIDAVRSCVQEIISLANKPPQPPPDDVVAEMLAVQGMLQENRLTDAVDKIDTLYTLWTHSLTESASRGLKPMSDSTRFSRIAQLTGALAKIGRIKKLMEDSSTYSRDEVKAMFSKFATIAQECIVNPSEDRASVWEQFVEKIKNVEER